MFPHFQQVNAEIALLQAQTEKRHEEELMALEQVWCTPGSSPSHQLQQQQLTLLVCCRSLLQKQKLTAPPSLQRRMPWRKPQHRQSLHSQEKLALRSEGFVSHSLPFAATAVCHAVLLCVLLAVGSNNSQSNKAGPLTDSVATNCHLCRRRRHGRRRSEDGASKRVNQRKAQLAKRYSTRSGAHS